MKNLKNKIMAILVVFTMVLTLCPANLAVAAPKTAIQTKDLTLEVGKSSKIILTGKVSTSTYSFSSSNKKVATVSKDGKVKAVKAGTAKITVKATDKDKKTTKVGTVAVEVKKAGGASAQIDLSTVSAEGSATYDEGSKSVKIVGSTASFALPAEVKNGQTITVTVSGKYNGSKGFRSWLIDDVQNTFSDIADTSVFPTKAGKFTVTYKLTATSTCTRLFFKGPSWDNPSIDDLTITSITVK